MKIINKHKTRTGSDLYKDLVKEREEYESGEFWNGGHDCRDNGDDKFIYEKRRNIDTERVFKRSKNVVEKHLEGSDFYNGLDGFLSAFSFEKGSVGHGYLKDAIVYNANITPFTTANYDLVGMLRNRSAVSVMTSVRRLLYDTPNYRQVFTGICGINSEPENSNKQILARTVSDMAGVYTLYRTLGGVLDRLHESDKSKSG